jgi:hypothetical protein
MNRDVNSTKHLEQISMKYEVQCRHSPKHIPQSPWRIVRITAENTSPLHSTPNTRIMKMSTSAVWPHITTNWVITCENRISNGVTPANKITFLDKVLLFRTVFWKPSVWNRKAKEAQNSVCDMWTLENFTTDWPVPGNLHPISPLLTLTGSVTHTYKCH